MDAHVEELATAPFGEFERAFNGGDRINGVAADHDHAADFTAVDAGLGVEVGGVEAAHEAEHEHLVRIGFDGLLGELALGDIGAERLFREDMLAMLEGNADVLRVQGGGRDDDDRIKLGIFAHLGEVGIAELDVELIGNLGDAGCVDVANGGELALRDF